MAASQESGVLSLSDRGAIDTASSWAAKVAGSAAVSGKLALRGTAEQLKSALTAIGGKADLQSAVITLKGGTPAKS